jgi:hypothetical protein
MDVYIRRADGNDSFSLHNGLFGAATTALHALIRQFQDGTIVRSILADIGELDPPYHQPGDWPRLAAFREAIDDGADCTAKAIEF